MILRILALVWIATLMLFATNLCFGQTIWLVDATPPGFEHYYNAYVKTVSNSKYGSKLTIVTSFDKVVKKAGDCWVLISASSMRTAESGYLFDHTYGLVDNCLNFAFHTTRSGVVYDDFEQRRLFGFDNASDFVSYVNTQFDSKR
jgi:hypothetical protein